MHRDRGEEGEGSRLRLTSVELALAHRSRSSRGRGRRTLGDREAARSTSVAFTYDCYGHLFPEIDHLAAVKLEAIRTHGLGATAALGS